MSTLRLIGRVIAHERGLFGGALVLGGGAAAAALGIKLPTAILAQADEVIE